jgi:hypothetical protein
MQQHRCPSPARQPSPSRLLSTRSALIVTGLSILFVLATAAPAAAASFDQKMAVMSGWSQTSRASYQSWNNARQDQGSWESYEFDWSTDYCSASPDEPLGFNFRLSCWRHDFGYRNYHLLDRFDANKSRVDDAFYADLRAKCRTYSVWVRPACYSLAWTYYEAVSLFGSLAVSKADLDYAAQLKAQGEANAIAAAHRS